MKPSVTRALPNHLAGVTCLLIFAAGLIRLEAAKVAPVPNDAPKPEIIGEGAISTPDDEFGGSLSPDGTTIYFDVTVPPHYLYVLCESHLVNGQWQKPEVLPFSGSYRDSDPVLTPDGNTCFSLPTVRGTAWKATASIFGLYAGPRKDGLTFTR